MNVKTQTRFSIAILALLMLAGCTDHSLEEQYTAERMFFRADKLRQSVMLNPRIASVTDYDAALAAYERLWDRFQNRSENAVIEQVKKQSLVRIAELWALRGEVQMALATYDRFLENYPRDEKFGAFIHFANAKGNERIFNIDKAITEYEALVANFGQIEDPFDMQENVLNVPLKIARLKRSKAEITEPNNAYKEALRYYDAVLEKWPDSPAAFLTSYYKASVHADLGEWHEMTRLLTKLVKQYPDREEVPNILLSLGNIYLDGLNQPLQAKKVFDGLLRKFADHPVKGYALLGNARVLLQQNHRQEGRVLLKSIIENHVENQALCASAQLTLATSYEAEGNWERALVEYRWVQEKYPLTFQGFYVPSYIAEHYRQKGDLSLAATAFNQAIEHYRHLIKKHPKTVLAGTAQEYIIYCLSVQEKWEDAAEAAVSLRNIHPGSYADISSFLFLGQIYERSSSFAKAIEIYEKFTQEFPDHPITAQIREKISDMRKRI